MYLNSAISEPPKSRSLNFTSELPLLSTNETASIMLSLLASYSRLNEIPDLPSLV